MQDNSNSSEAIEMIAMHPIIRLSEMYPQILFPIESGMYNTDEYKNVCLRGFKCDRKPDFIFSNQDTLEIIDTEAGPATILTLRCREDFVHMIQCLSYKCEPTEIPDSMGASTIIGLNNWDKVRAGEDNYKDMIIVLSSGNYSNVSATDVSRATDGKLKLSDDEWIEKSIIIRKYHELRHFVDRRLRPDDIDVLRDEINADRDGLIAAFGYYDTDLARLFLGIEGTEYRQGGRLENYLPDGITMADFINQARTKIETCFMQSGTR